jgi:hypothetical protein
VFEGFTKGTKRNVHVAVQTANFPRIFGVRPYIADERRVSGLEVLEARVVQFDKTASAFSKSVHEFRSIPGDR